MFLLAELPLELLEQGFALLPRQGFILAPGNRFFYAVALGLDAAPMFLGHEYSVLWTNNEGEKFREVVFLYKVGWGMEVCFGHD